MRSFLKSIGTLIAEDGEDVRGTSKLLYLVWFIEGFMSRLKVYSQTTGKEGLLQHSSLESLHDKKSTVWLDASFPN